MLLFQHLQIPLKLLPLFPPLSFQLRKLALKSFSNFSLFCLGELVQILFCFELAVPARSLECVMFLEEFQSAGQLLDFPIFGRDYRPELSALIVFELLGFGLRTGFALCLVDCCLCLAPHFIVCLLYFSSEGLYFVLELNYPRFIAQCLKVEPFPHLYLLPQLLLLLFP